MIQDLDAQLSDWLEPLVRPATLSLQPPATGPEGRGVSLYLSSLAAAPTSRGPQRAPHQVKLRYLVTTWGPSPQDAHQLLDTLLFAALDRADVEVDLSPVDIAFWQAFGARPQPSFFLCVPLSRPRPEAVAPLVRRPLVVRSVDLRELHGLVLGNDGVPVAGARVTLRRFDRSAETDSSGRFSLVGVPAGAVAADFVVHARGRRPTTTVDLPAAPDAPFVLHVDLLER